MGTIYLLHFSKPYKHAKHYLGFTNNLSQRIKDHKDGNGARLLQVIKEANIDFILVRTWDGSRTLERRLKKGKNSPYLCPICRTAIKTCSSSQKMVEQV